MRVLLVIAVVAIGASAPGPVHAQRVADSAMTAKQQVEQLMNEGIPFAQKMLSQYGEFYPFAIVLTSEGKIEHLAASDGSEHPSSQSLVDMLIGSFRRDANEGKYKAIAVFVNVRVQHPAGGRKVDAVQVGLEHRDGYCADVFFPYSLNGQSVEFAEIFASKRDGSVYKCGS